MISKENLDKRICLVEQKASNIQTYREFIRESEECFGIDNLDLDNMSDIELNDYLDWLDTLWDK